MDRCGTVTSVSSREKKKKIEINKDAVQSCLYLDYLQTRASNKQVTNARLHSTSIV